MLKDAGAQVVGVGAHSFRAIDLTDSILRAKNAAPDVWIKPATSPTLTCCCAPRVIRDFKPAAMIIVGTGDTYETLDSLGAIASKVFSSSPTRATT